MCAKAARLSGSPRAPFRTFPSTLMFFARSLDQAGDRKRRSSRDSSNARCGNSRTPPPSSVRIAVCCSSGAFGRQLARSSETIGVMGRTARCGIATRLGLRNLICAAIPRCCASEAAPSCPREIRRPRARTGGLRGSPTRSATGRAAYRRPRISLAPMSGSSRCRRRHCPGHRI